jgi:hypothetical protein
MLFSEKYARVCARHGVLWSLGSLAGSEAKEVDGQSVYLTRGSGSQSAIGSALPVNGSNGS